MTECPNCQSNDIYQHAHVRDVFRHSTTRAIDMIHCRNRHTTTLKDTKGNLRMQHE